MSNYFLVCYFYIIIKDNAYQKHGLLTDFGNSMNDCIRETEYLYCFISSSTIMELFGVIEISGKINKSVCDGLCSEGGWLQRCRWCAGGLAMQGVTYLRVVARAIFSGGSPPDRCILHLFSIAIVITIHISDRFSE